MPEVSAATIQVKLPDGSVKQLPKGSTALDVARSISPRLADAAIVASAKSMNNGEEPRLIDLTRPIEKDVELRILTERDPEALEVFRHSSAHLLAAAVLELFPETKLDTVRRPRMVSSTTSIARSHSRLKTSKSSRPRCRSWSQQNIPYARELLPREEGLEAVQARRRFHEVPLHRAIHQAR